MKLYHATFRSYLSNIEKRGLLPGQNKNWSNCEDGFVYLADDPDVAVSFCETAEDVSDDIYESGICCFEVDTKVLDMGLLFDDPNIQKDEDEPVRCYGYAGTIPYQSLTLIPFENYLGDPLQVRIQSAATRAGKTTPETTRPSQELTIK